MSRFFIASDDKARTVFNNIIQDIIYGWHNRLWNNSFNNLDMNEENLSANIFVKVNTSLFLIISIILNYLLLIPIIFIEY